MRKYAVALALATTALASPALAKDGAWYIGVDAGGMLVEDSKFDIRNAAGTATTDSAIRLNHEYGYDVSGNVGYDFGPIRAEFEVGYKDANLDSIDYSGVVPIRGFNGPSRVYPAQNYGAADGNSRVLSFMTNAYADFGGKDMGISGFLGGGVGVARVKLADIQTVKYGQAFLDDSDTRFAWQILAGIRKPITDKVDISLKYRFFNVNNIKTFTVDNQATESRFRSHSILLGLTYNFGEPAAPPPPPPPPPPPRLPRRRRCRRARLLR